MENPKGEPSRILLSDLEKEYYRLRFLVDMKAEHLKKEMEVSMKAGDIVGKLYDPTLMPKELLQVHRQNDRLVMQAYGFFTKMT